MKIRPHSLQSPKIFWGLAGTEKCGLYGLSSTWKNDNITWIKFSRKTSCNLQRWTLIILYHAPSVIPLGLRLLCFLWFYVNEEGKCLSESKWSILTTVPIMKGYQYVLQMNFKRTFVTDHSNRSQKHCKVRTTESSWNILSWQGPTAIFEFCLYTGSPQSHTMCLRVLSKHFLNSLRLWPLHWGTFSQSLIGWEAF